LSQLDGIRASFHARPMKCFHHQIFFTNSYNPRWRTIEGTMSWLKQYKLLETWLQLY